MKKLIILFLSLICCSCTQYLADDEGIVTRVELSDKEGIFNVYLKEIDGISLCYSDLCDLPRTVYFKTSTLYRVGDTIKFAKL